MNLTCPDCGHVAALGPSQLNPDGSYFGRCPKCGRRLIRQTLASVSESSVAIKNKISIHEAASVFYADYENWREDIPKMLKEMKKIMYPNIPRVGHYVAEGGPPKWALWTEFNVINPEIAVYRIALKSPVFLLKKHRIFLEKKLVSIEKYIWDSPDFLLPFMEDDHKKVKDGLRLIMEAKERMIKNFPSMPLEHDELLPSMTCKIKLIRTATWLSIWPMALLIKFIVEYAFPNYNLAALISIIPQTLFGGLTPSQLKDISPTPVESLLVFLLAYCYLPIFIWQEYRYPGFRAMYEPFSFKCSSPGYNIISIFIVLLVCLFFCPEYLVAFIFSFRFYNPVTILWVIILFGSVSYLIGAAFFFINPRPHYKIVRIIRRPKWHRRFWV